MKKLMLVLTCLVVSTVAHAESRTFKKVSAEKATVKILPDGGADSGVQAAEFVDAQENDQFIKMLLADPTSTLAKLRTQIEKETCEGATSTPENPWIDGCGEVEVTNSVQTSFGRGGWMGAGAGYTFFVGFRNDGTGHFFEASHMFTITEDVSADVNDEGEYIGSVTKDLSFGKLTKLPESQN